MKEYIVYDGWLKVYKREVKGRLYDIIKNYDAVSVFLINEYSEVLIVEQYRPALMTETLEIPAGVIDKEDESPEQCAVRELQEETGISLDPNSLRKIVQYKPMMGFSSSTMHIFIGNVSKSSAEININPSEEDVFNAFWMPIDELKTRIEKGEIFDGKTLMAFYRYMGEERL